MRLFGGRAAERAERKVWNAHLRRSNDRQAEIETLQFLLTSIKKRHTWDRIKCTIALGIPAFWILMIAFRPYLPTWLHPLLENVPAIWTIAVSLAIAGFQWRNLLYYQRQVIPLVQEMYERAMAKHDRELLTVLSNVLRTEAGLIERGESLRQDSKLHLGNQEGEKHERGHELDAEHECMGADVAAADRNQTDGPNPSPMQDDGEGHGRNADREDGEQRGAPSGLSDRVHIEGCPSDEKGQRHAGCGSQGDWNQAARGHVPILRRASASGVAGSQSTTCATRRSCEIRLSRSIRRIRYAVLSSGRCCPSLHAIARGDGETIATAYPRASIAMTALRAARSSRGEINTMRQSRGKNRDRTQATCANGHSPPGRTWVRWSRIRYSCFRPNAGGTQSRTSRCTIRPTRFFDASTWSAIPSAARTPCSIGFSVSVPMNDSRRASTTITTSPERSPSYSFVKSRSRRADAFQLMRRTSSPATYSRTPQNSVPGPIRREATCPNHGRVRRGWSAARRRSSIAGATTSGDRTSRTTSWAPRASGSNDRARTGPRTKSPFTAERILYARRRVPSFSRDTTAWFVPRRTTNSRGRTSAISTRSRDGPSFRTTSSTSTSRPASVRSADSDRRATIRGLGD